MRIFPNSNNLPIELLRYRFEDVEQIDLRHTLTKDGSLVSNLIVISTLTDAEIQALLTPATAQEISEIADHHINRAELKAQVITAISRLTQIGTAANPSTAQLIAAIKDIAYYEKEIIKILVRII